VNDDQSPLLNLITCVVCNQTMRLERIDPDNRGNEIIHYRCKLCHGVERLRLFRPRRNLTPKGDCLFVRTPERLRPIKVARCAASSKPDSVAWKASLSPPRRTIPAWPSLSREQKARWKSMLSALELIINGYIKLNDGAALARMKAHRQRLVAGVGDGGPFDRSPPLDTLNGEIALIDAGLEKMRSRNPEAAN
jgi:hypothetical protein